MAAARLIELWHWLVVPHLVKQVKSKDFFRELPLHTAPSCQEDRSVLKVGQRKVLQLLLELGQVDPLHPYAVV